MAPSKTHCIFSQENVCGSYQGYLQDDMQKYPSYYKTIEKQNADMEQAYLKALKSIPLVANKDGDGPEKIIPVVVHIIHDMGAENVSDETAALIDKEVRKLIEEAEKTAREILTSKSDDLESLAQALLEFETLSGDEIVAILNGESIIRDGGDSDAPSNSSSEDATS